MYIRTAFIVFFLILGFVLASARAESPVPAIAPWNVKFERLAGLANNAGIDREDSYETRERKPAIRVEKPQGLKKILSVPEEKKSSPSALEGMYAKRIVDELPQFGYDLFGVPDQNTRQQLDSVSAGGAFMPMGEAQDDFVLSSGDELEIVFTGQRTSRETYKIDSRGMLMINDFPPIPAEGRTIGQVRISVESVAGNLHNTQAFISLSSVRQIGVLIIGHAKKPGRQTMTVFHTVLDALMAAGGIQKTGSLRQIKLVRDGRSIMIDLYALLMHGSTNIDLRLKDGDRIIVPAIGPTVAIAGEVKRPGIFEILPALGGMMTKPERKSEKLTLDEMLELAGGVLAPGQNRFLELEVTPDGRENVTEIGDSFAPVFGDGSILMVSKGDERRAGTVELQGHTRRPGLHALQKNDTLGKLLKSEDILGPDIYPLIGVIERRDTDQMTEKLVDFPLRLVLKGGYDRKLEDGDVVHLFSMQQIRNLAQENPQAQITEIAYGSGYGEDSIDDEDHINDPGMQDFLKERSVFVRGAVRAPGPYPVSTGATMDTVIAAAGGMSLEASSSNIEVTSALSGEGLQQGERSGTRRQRIDLREARAEDVMLEAGDSVRVNQKFRKVEDNSVLIIGEIANPGRYDLIAGDKVSDLVGRAGGLTPQAYADGAIFSRESERRAEEARFKSQAQGMRRAISAALAEDDKKIDTGKIEEARALATELENAQGVGRITVETDPAALTTNPELDMLLEPGDRLYIPKRALTVRVSGEVLSPASLQFREGKKPLDYINEAGGFTFGADKDRTFVLYPDGSAQPLEVGAWNYNPVFIPPGSTIVVPRDPKPFDFMESAKDISQILSNLAVTAIFIDDVRSGD